MIDEIGVQQPRWSELSSAESALAFAKEVGYPGMQHFAYLIVLSLNFFLSPLAAACLIL
jgi:hypothetical protein